MKGAVQSLQRAVYIKDDVAVRMSPHRGSEQAGRAAQKPTFPPACTPWQSTAEWNTGVCMSAARCGEEPSIAEMGGIQLVVKGFDGLQKMRHNIFTSILAWGCIQHKLIHVIIMYFPCLCFNIVEAFSLASRILPCRKRDRQVGWKARQLA